MLILIAPIVGWTLPALTPILTAAAGYLGFKHFTARGEGAWAQGELEQRLRTQRIVTVPLRSETVEPVSEEMKRDEFLTFRREEDDVTLVFRKDERGRFHVDVIGQTSRSALDLTAIGEEFALTLIQEFAHSRLVRELDRKGITVIEEERAENGDLILRTRKWG